LLRLLLPLGSALFRTLVLQPTRVGRETGTTNSLPQIPFGSSYGRFVQR